MVRFPQRQAVHNCAERLVQPRHAADAFQPLPAMRANPAAIRLLISALWCTLPGTCFRSSEIVEDVLDGSHMDLHLYPTTLSRDRAMRESTRTQGFLFDHRYFTYAELSERLFRSESLRVDSSSLPPIPCSCATASRHRWGRPHRPVWWLNFAVLSVSSREPGLRSRIFRLASACWTLRFLLRPVRHCIGSSKYGAATKVTWLRPAC